jgi:hypothetical protein
VELKSRIFPLIAFSIVACAVSPSSGFGQDAPLPPPVFHPQPGPWLVGFKPGSAEFLDDNQSATIEKAMQSWGRVEGYGFLLCYDGENRGTLPIDKVRAVADALYEAGAGSVMNGSPLCYLLKPFPWSPSEGVIILGVTTFRR